jgi:hypothetical protein
MQTKYKKLGAKINKLTETQTKKPHKTYTFYPRVVNKSNIPFSDAEMALLQKGLKYNLHTKHNDWLKNLALEAETAIAYIPTADRDIYRKQVAERIITLHRDSRHTPTPKAQQ